MTQRRIRSSGIACCAVAGWVLAAGCSPAPQPTPTPPAPPLAAQTSLLPTTEVRSTPVTSPPRNMTAATAAPAAQAPADPPRAQATHVAVTLLPPNAQPPQRPAIKPAPLPVSPVRHDPPPAPAPVIDPQKDPAFQAVQQARAQSGDKPQLVVLACTNYLPSHPTGPGTAEVQAIEDEALDQIWWSSIDQLCHRRDQQRRNLLDNKTRITAQTRDDETPPALLQEKASLEKKLADTEEQLRGLSYASAAPPPLSNATGLAKLRSARDPQTYGWWKKLECQKIHDSNGAAW